MTVEISNEQMNELADMLAERIGAKGSHECPFRDTEERKKLHALTSESSVKSAAFLGRTGSLLHTATNKLSIAIMIAIVIVILGVFGAVAIPRAVTTLILR